MNGKNHEKLVMRLVDILVRLNSGERLDIQELKENYKVSLRTVQRDLKERLVSLTFHEAGPRYYRIDKNKQGHLNREEIQRIAHFASIQGLFPEVDRRFFQDQLHQSIMVKGFQYENMRHKQKEFDAITQAIEQQHCLNFTYRKVGRAESKNYQIEPYHMVNKNGIWYLVGIDNGKKKTFCFNQIEELSTSTDTFACNEKLRQKIRQSDSIFYSNQISEIVIKVNAKAAGYFKRRNLLPNQEIVRELEDGS